MRGFEDNKCRSGVHGNCGKMGGNVARVRKTENAQEIWLKNFKGKTSFRRI